MSGKPKLHYFNGRGRMEPIRWLLAAAGVEVCLCFLTLRACYKHVLLMFPMKNVTEIDMYVEGMFDLNELFMHSVAQPADKKEQHFTNMLDKAANRYFPAFEKVLKDHGQDFLVGNQLSRADVQLLEIILMAEEFKPDILAKFPLLQRFKARISNIPTIKKFLQPGSQRKPPMQPEDLPKVLAIFY
ncbi:glutathione S-transferase-like [Empidonax traillii]|uniref:glutathione S-transferase-like n=1 Tax=Empidonax traillii TaxID=164674 RepID=UPI000FFD2582|nr:glutathione S-transferase-like [Empidonax traillii]